MKELAAIFLQAGCANVRTYIQSGNVVFKADAKSAQKISDVISKEIKKAHKLDVPVVVRSAKELLKISKANPFFKKGGTVDTVHVAFLVHTPQKTAIQSLDAKRSPGDAFEVAGSEVYLHCPNGFGSTKLTNQYFDSKLATTSTIRNWKTVLKLVEMTQATP